MSGEVDELFSDGVDAPRPRSRLVLGLLGGGMLLSTVGLACSVVPGVVLVLLAWVVIEKEMDRVQTGFLAADQRTEVVRLRNITRGVVVVSILLILAQVGLLRAGVYDWLLQSLIMQFAGATPPPA